MSEFPRIEIIGITGIPEIVEGDDLSKMIVYAAREQGTPLVDNDILVVTQKVVSKSEGRLVNLNDVVPSAFASQLAKDMAKDSRLVELVLQESRSIVRMDVERGVMITETKHGFVCANAGIDASNVPGDDWVCLLPVDSDKSALGIRQAIAALTGGTEIGIVISDTFGRAWREGHSNFAIGVAGVELMKDYRGTLDANNRELKATTIAVIDELAAAAEMVTAKAINVPVALVRGYEHGNSCPDGIKPMIRERSRDLFR